MRDDPRRPNELITAGRIAALLDVTPSAVSNWQKRTQEGRLQPPFPDPWLEVPSYTPRKGGTALFVLEEVEAWYAKRRAIELARNARNIARLEAQLAAARKQSGAIGRRGPGTVSR